MAKLVIKVLIIDDSLLFREKIKQEISKDITIEVVGTAEDPYIARDKIIQLNPHVLVLDVEMPKMNGIEFLKKLMPQYPLPVVVVSSQSKNVFEAMNAGAVDFVSKPDFRDDIGMTSFVAELTLKIKIASIAKVAHLKKNVNSSMMHIVSRSLEQERVIAIGSSTGGTEAISQIIQALPKDIPGIVVVQHMPAIFTRMYAERLNNSCHFDIKEAENGDIVSSGKVLIAPGGYHMKLTKNMKGYSVECFSGENINGHCPSVDVLFNSVAEVAKKNAIGVILTGMGNDGAKGLLNMRSMGAMTIGQDEQTSVVYGMPKAAYDMDAVVLQASLDKIPEMIYSICSKQTDNREAKPNGD